MRAWISALLVAPTLLVCACQSNQPSPNLLSLTGFSPEEVEIGERIEVLGSEFPEGKPATLTFRGTVCRVGQEPRELVEIVAAAKSVSRTSLSALLSEQLYAEFTGHGGEARHATFHGEVTAALAAQRPDSPPVTGSLGGVILDLPSPAAAADVNERNEREGRRLLAFSGIELDPSQQDRLVVKARLQGGRSEQAGLEVGDEIVEFEGVRAHRAADLVPASASRRVRLLVRNAQSQDMVERVLDIDGFWIGAPKELSRAATLLGLALLLLAVIAVPWRGAVSWAERRVTARFRSVLERRPALECERPWRRVLRSLESHLPRAPAPSQSLRLAPWLTFIVSTLGLTRLAFGKSWLLPELDLIVLLVGSFTALALLAFALGGFCKDRSWSPLGGIKHAALVSSCQFPAYAAVISSVIASGSLRLRDIVLSQGPAPWNWQAFKSPISLFSFLIFVIAAVPEQGRSSADLPELTPELGFSEEPPPPHWHALSVFAIWGGLLVTGTLGATVFLGGWQVPFASASDQRSSAVYQTLGAVLVIAKSWAMIGLVLALRWISLRVRSEQVAGIFFRWLIPASIMALVASSASAALHEHPLWQALDQGMGLLLFAVIASLTGYFVHRIARSLRSSPAMTVNPWL